VKSFAGLGYNPADIVTALTSSGRQMRYRHEWLTAVNTSKGFLSCIHTGASVSNSALASIKRTMTGTLLADIDPGFNFLSDRLRPWLGVRMPDGGWVDMPQGVFLLSQPGRKYNNGMTTRPFTGYDQGQVLSDLKIGASRYVAKTGVLYTDIITSLTAACPQMNIVPSDLTVPADRMWDPGTSYLQIVNDCCTAISYNSVWFDGFGVGQVGPYVLPADAPAGFTYTNVGNQALFTPEVDETLDLFSVPNYISYSVSQPGRPVLTATWANNEPSSPVSIPARGRVIPLVDASQDVATQVELAALVRRAGINAANVYRKITFNTPAMPMHENRDTLAITHSGLGLTGNYTETDWKLTLAAGAQMEHTVRQVVNIDPSLTGLPDDGS